MRIMRSAALLTVLVLTAPDALRAQDALAPSPAPLPTATLPTEIDRVLRDYERGWRAGDEAALAALFAEDGFILQNGRLAVRGRAAIQQAYAESGGPLRLRALGFAADDSVGYIVGAYGYGEGEADMGKFVLALRRAPGGPWMIAADIDNMSQMPRRPPQTERPAPQR
jgi:ketosteroid isomerase-like protein